MNKNWISIGNYIFKETEDKFLLISCVTWNIEDNKIYCPTIHSIYKDKYTKKDIIDLVKKIFPCKENVDFYTGIVLLSPFIGECKDIYNDNNERLSFNLNKNDILVEKLLSIAEEFNL